MCQWRKREKGGAGGPGEQAVNYRECGALPLFLEVHGVCTDWMRRERFQFEGLKHVVPSGRRKEVDDRASGGNHFRSFQFLRARACELGLSFRECVRLHGGEEGGVGRGE